MSRTSECDCDEDYPGQFALWQANVDRALAGKNGRKTLRDLRDALLALPEKRLISRALCTVNPEQRKEGMTNFSQGDFDDLLHHEGEGVCAVGALAWWRLKRRGMSDAEAFAALPLLSDNDYGVSDTAAYAKNNCSISFVLAWQLAWINDDQYWFGECTPEERYTRFLEWIDQELERDAVAA